MRSILPYITIFTILAIMLAGCALLPAPTEPAASLIESAQTDSPETLGPTTESTIPAESTEATACKLSIAPGEYRMRYRDADSGDYLDYYLFVPKNAVENMPLIIFLHGDGEVGRIDVLQNYGMIAQAKNIFGDEYPFLAIQPCTRSRSWIDHSIVQTLMGLIEATVSEYAVDSKSIIVTGHSRGAIGVWNLISLYGDYFSAALPVSCGNEKAMNYDVCTAVPVWAFAGDADSGEQHYQQTMRKIVDEIVKRGGNAEFTVLEGYAHRDTVRAAYTYETFEWMLTAGGVG